MNQSQILAGIRKRFLQEFNRVQYKNGEIMGRQNLAKAIGMDAARVSRLDDKKNPTTPMHNHIYSLCKNYGADLNYIYFGEKKGEEKLKSEIQKLLRKY